MRRNRRNAAAFRIEREQLQDLPERRTTDFVEEEARVTRCGTFTVRAILYSAPSRLTGHRLKVRLYSDRLDCYLGGARVLTLARGIRSPINGRGRMLDYRHFIEALKRKPQAFKGLAFRDALFPREASMAKLKATETARRATLEGMQMMGGYGYAVEYDMERQVRTAIVTTIYGGTSEIQRDIIAKTYGL